MATHQARQEVRKVSLSQRGDISLVNLDPTVGAEIRKTQPALVIQNDIGNRYSPITEESGLRLRSAALLNEIRSIDRPHLVTRLGHADPATNRVDQAIQISLGLFKM